jgi:hypothetical protein
MRVAYGAYAPHPFACFEVDLLSILGVVLVVDVCKLFVTRMLFCDLRLLSSPFITRIFFSS